MCITHLYLLFRSHKPKHPIFCPASRERTSDIQGAASFRWVFLLQEHATGSSDAKALLILTPDYVVLHRVPPVKPYTSWLNWISNSGVPISGNRQDPLPKSQTLLKQSSSCPLSARFLFAINVVYLTYHKKKAFLCRHQQDIPKCLVVTSIQKSSNSSFRFMLHIHNALKLLQTKLLKRYVGVCECSV